jgi:hypothetical protein
MVQKVVEKPNETTRMGLISSELSPDQFHAIIWELGLLWTAEVKDIENF